MPFILQDDDLAEIRVSEAVASEDDEAVEVVFQVEVIDGDNAGLGGGEGAGNSLQKLAVPVVVEYETADGTAVEGSDYRESEGVITFFGDELTRTVLIPLIGDSEPENSEEFTVTISNPVSPIPSRFPVLEGGKIIGPVYLPLAIAGTGSAQVTIIDGSSPSEDEAEPWADITSDNPDRSLEPVYDL